MENQPPAECDEDRDDPPRIFTGFCVKKKKRARLRSHYHRPRGPHVGLSEFTNARVDTRRLATGTTAAAQRVQSAVLTPDYVVPCSVISSLVATV